MATPVLSRELVCKPSESNASQALPLTMLVAQLIDIATDHANELNIGYHLLSPKGVGWVLSRLSVEMSRWPATGEKYILSTWIESWNQHFSERCFSVATTDGEVIGYARTIWVIIDLETHRSVGTAGMILPPESIKGEGCPIPKMSKHKPFEAEKETEYTFKYTDLDFYRHVNTIKYLSLLLNQFTLEEMDTHFISRFDIAFANEAKYGETALIDSLCEDVETPSMVKTEKESKKYNFEIKVDGRHILTSALILTRL